MSRPHILRLPRTDVPGEHLLLNVTKQRKDLKLVGTDQEHLYHTTIEASNIKRTQASNYAGTLDEWKAIINFVLLQQRDDEFPEEVFQGCETAAAIDQTALTITLRKNIGGITQRLGTIKLEQDDEREAVSAFDWVDAAVATTDELRLQMETLQASVSSQQDQIAKLNAQLDELVIAKKAHEEDLLKKFAKLLNAKKLKIRDQQRLLQRAKIDPDAAQAVRETRSSTTEHSRKAEPSRNGKRKAQVAAEEEDEGTGNEDHEDNDVENSDNGSKPNETPSGSEDDELDDAAEEQPSKDVQVDNMDLDDLPPARELPFKTMGSSSTHGRQTSDSKDDHDDDDEDDETEDEL